MERLSTVAAVRAWREGAPGASVGLVPTMGALHEGHLRLVDAARAACDRVAVSVFVNPSQFDDPADLARYPRDLERDAALLAGAGCDLLFAPPAEEMYPPGFDTWVVPGAVAGPNEGAFRAGHFRGVATVVLQLLNIVRPTRAFFGQKDAQQVAVVRALARDLHVPTAIVPCPTVRAADGLALSSRNAYLAPDERIAARVLSRALLAARAAFRDGVRDAEALRATARAALAGEPLAAPEYVSVADGTTMAELATVPERGAVISLAVRVGRARLLDNLVLGDDRLSGLDGLDLDALVAPASAGAAPDLTDLDRIARTATPSAPPDRSPDR